MKFAVQPPKKNRTGNTSRKKKRGSSAFPPLITARQIESRLAMMAHEIMQIAPRDEGDRLLAVIVLQGGFIFAADLLRSFPPEFGIDVAFVRCESYGQRMQSSGRVLLLQDIEPSINLSGRTILLIDDIFDSGLTISFLADHLRKRGAAKVMPCVLLHRRGGGRQADIFPKFAGFKVGPEFFVGYGLDFDGRYRHLPYLAALPQDSKVKR